MIKELPHYHVDGYYGGSQSWMKHPYMRIGGCGALTACDSCIYFAKYMGLEELYPFDVKRVSKRDYVKFGMIMKPYLPPRRTGIDKVDTYISEFQKYLDDRHCRAVSMAPFYGTESAEDAWDKVRAQIDKGFPVPMLMLRHQSPEFKEYIWHWFILNGYDDEEGTVRAVTYGAGEWLNFKSFWNTKEEPKGGIVLYDVK